MMSAIWPFGSIGMCATCLAEAFVMRVKVLGYLNEDGLLQLGLGFGQVQLLCVDLRGAAKVPADETTSARRWKRGHLALNCCAVLCYLKLSFPPS